MYFGKEIRGRVVDADTGVGLDSVSIVAEWQIYVTVIQPHLGPRLKVIEASTTSAGNYVVPGWGPRLRPLWGVLEEHSPALTFFKSGYYPKWVMNTRASDHMIRISDFDGKTIELKKFDGDLSRLNRLLLSTDAWLTGCWRDCPRYVLALDAEAKRLRNIVPTNMMFAFPRELESMSPPDRAYFSRFRQ
ncbi:MAG: hypothetical protein ACREYD_07320 [Casimicrobiaceae bacterium]